MDNSPPSGSTWILGQCGTFQWSFHITARRWTCLTPLSTPVWSLSEQGRNCNDMPPACTHQFSGCRSRRRSLDIDPFAASHTSHRHTPYPVFEDLSSEFYGLTAIQYQGEIILWLQREYGLHVQVEYTLYEDYLVAQNQCQNIYPKYTAHLSDLLLLNRVIKSIVHNDAWYLPENPEFEYGCLINIRGSIVYFTIPV